MSLFLAIRIQSVRVDGNHRAIFFGSDMDLVVTCKAAVIPY
jgi:hypothetical protein